MKMGKLLNYLFVIALLAFSVFCKAQGVQTSQRMIAPVEVNSTQSFNLNLNNYQDIGSQAVVTLGIDHIIGSFIGAPYEVAVTLDLDLTYSDGSTVSETRQLVINYEPDNTTLNFKDRNFILFDNVVNIVATVSLLTVTGLPDSDTLPGNAYIEVAILPKKVLTLDASLIITNIEINPISQFCFGQELVHDFAIMWEPLEGAVDYQLEWTFVNDYGESINTYITTPSSLELDFKHNSTRISTQENYYIIPNLFDHGYLVVRLRARGCNASNPDEFYFTDWSDNPVNVDLAANKILVETPHEASLNWQVTTSFAEEGKKKEVISYFDGTLRNRQSVTRLNHDQNVIVGETGYDYQGRPAINILPVPVKIDGCTVNDDPSPLRFYPNFNQVITGNSQANLNPMMFDVNSPSSCGTPELTFSNTTGAALYYSSNNPDQLDYQAYVPEANGKVYSQVIYTPDNTGRIAMQSGVGAEFGINSGHATRYLYGTPIQIELDRLFGGEVGFANHYQKNVVLDPNGQASVSYLDQEGRVIATALSGESPDNLMELESNSVSSSLSDLEIVLFDSQNELFQSDNHINELDGTLTFSKTFVVSYPTEFTFNYSMEHSPLSIECINADICLNCAYDLEIHLLNECGEEMWLINGESPSIGIGYLTNESGLVFNTDCATNPTEFSATKILNLPVGSYTISKVLKVNTTVRDYYLNQYLTNQFGNCTDDVQVFIDAEIAELDPTDCEVDCQSCLESLGSVDNYVANGGTYDEWYYHYSLCQEMCEVYDPCAVPYQMMISDVSPGGQYANFISVENNSGDGLDYTYVFQTNLDNSTSLLDEDNKLPDNLYTDAHWRLPLYQQGSQTLPEYRDAYNQRSKIYLTIEENGDFFPEVLAGVDPIFEFSSGSFFIYPEQLAHVEDFVNYWDVNWAKSLISYHPEFCYYEECLKFYNFKEPQNSNAWSNRALDSLLYNSNSLFLASASNLITLNNVNNLAAGFTLQPWIDASSGSAPEDVFVTYTGEFESFGDDLLEKYSHYLYHDGVSYSMPQIAAMMNRAQNLFGNGVDIEPWMIAFGQPIVGLSNQENEELLEAEWQSLATMYLATKNEIVSKYFDFVAMTCDDCLCFNDCIGKEQWNFFSTYPNFYTPPTDDGPIYELDQPCGMNRKVYFKNKQPRWICASDIPSVDAALDMTMEDYAYNLYMQTGLCPVDYSLQSVLNELAADQNLDSPTEVNMMSLSSFGGLIYALQDFYAPENSTEYDWGWTALQSGNTLTVQISDVSSSTVICDLSLIKSGSWAWDEVQLFTELTPIYDSNGNYTFFIQAGVADQESGDLVWRDIQGHTDCFPLGQCHFEDQCTPTEVANQYLEMLNWVQGEGNAGITGSYSISSSTSENFGQALQNYLGGNTDIHWEFFPSSGEVKIGCLASGFKMYMQILSSEPAMPSYQYLSDAEYFTNIQSEFENNFSFEVWTNGEKVATVHAKLTYEQDDGIQVVPMGTCSDPTNLFCTGNPYDNFNDLEFWLIDVLSNGISDPDQSLLFTSNIAEHFIVEPGLCQLEIHEVENDEFVSLVISGNEGEGNFSDCQIVLSLPNDAVQNFGSIVSFGEMTVYGESGVSGYHNAFKIAVVIDNGGVQVETYIYGTTCMDLAECIQDCEDGRLDDDGREDVSEEDKYEIDTTVATYYEYKNAVETFNTEHGLTSEELNFIDLISYSEYYREGCYITTKEYILKLREFKDEVDSYEEIASIIDFSRNYGNYTNPKEEWVRYNKAIDKYNERALEEGLFELTPIEDSLFFNYSFADSLDQYLNYLETASNPYFAPASLTQYYYWLVYDYTTSTDCEDLYRYYVMTYTMWATEQLNNQTCESFSPKNEMVSMKTFMSLGYCEDSLGFATFSYFIESIENTEECLPDLPKKFTKLDDDGKITSEDCQSNYSKYKALMQAYMTSSYHGGNPYRDLEIVAPYSSFEAEGYCDCVMAYISYLSPYLQYNYNAAVPLPVSIVDWEGCNTLNWEENPCDRTAWRQYEDIIANFNQYCHDNEITDFNIYRVTYEEFYSEELCDCLDEWAAYLQTLIDMKVTKLPVEEQYKMNLAKFCENEAPCAPEVSLLEDFPELAPIEYVDPCLQGQSNMAYGNGVLAWQNYIAALTEDFVTSYNDHCMQPIEHMDEQYTDKEYHYTLYYYDQAGNLIKTVPPAGVQRLDINASNDELALRIQHDRLYHEKTVFTNHLMATKYEYNSLNQLVRQYLPDHDAMEISEVYLPNGLPENLSIVDIVMTDGANGWLIGNVASDPNSGSSEVFGRLYNTVNSGSSWTRVNNVFGADLRSIAWLDDQNGIACGEKGALLRTFDSGQSWYEMVVGGNFQANLNDIVIIDNSLIYAFGDQGKIVKSTNQGLSWTQVSSNFSANDNLISAVKHTNGIYFTLSTQVEDFRKSKVFLLNTISQAISEVSIFTENILGLNEGSQDIVSAHGQDGQLFLFKPWTWNGNVTLDLLAVSTNLNTPIRDSYFVDELKGLIVTGDNPNTSKLYATYDGGDTWNLISPTNHFYKEIVPYCDEAGGIKKLIGVRTTGDLDRIVFESTCGLIPISTEGLADVRFLDVNFSTSVSSAFPAVAAHSTNASYTLDITTSAPTWLPLGNGTFKDVAIKTVNTNQAVGLLVNTSGDLKAFFASNTTTTIFNTASTSILKCVTDHNLMFGYSLSSNGVVSSWNLASLPGNGGNSISPTSSFTLPSLSSEDVFVDIAVRNGRLVVSSRFGMISEISVNASGVLSSSTQVDGIGFASEIKQINEFESQLIAVGENGGVYVSEGSGFILKATNMADDLNAVTRNNNFIWFGAVNGKVFKALPNIDNLNCSAITIPGNMGNTINQFEMSSNLLFAITNNGKVWKTPLAGGTGFSIVPTGISQHLYCAAKHGTSDQIYIAGQSGRMLKLVSNSIVPVSNINICEVRDLDVHVDGMALITESNGRLRYTSNFANGWRVPVLNSGLTNTNWSVGKAAMNGQFRLAGNGFIAKITNDEVVQINSIPSTIVANIHAIESADQFVYTGSNGTTGKVILEIGGVFSTNSFSSKPFNVSTTIPGSNKIGAIYSNAGSQHLAIINVTSTSALENSFSLNCSGVQDLAFTDLLNFMVVGDNGLWKSYEIVLSSDLNSPNYASATLTSGTSLNPVSTVFIDQNDASLFDFSCIAFSGSHKGILGANYDGTGNQSVRRFEEMSGEYSTLFYYDKLGRIVLSQNSKQKGDTGSTNNQQYFSYTLYDELGRVYEAGVKAENPTGQIQFRDIIGDFVNSTFNPNVINDEMMLTWLATGAEELDVTGDSSPDIVLNESRSEVTRSLYDEAVNEAYDTQLPTDFVQENLRKRVSAVYYMEKWVDKMEVGENIYFGSATYYSYDIHGNVNSLIQDLPSMTLSNSNYAEQRFKRMDYEYDLISGNVHEMSYQKGKMDAWHHHYIYDADNRIQEVYTSKQPHPVDFSTYTTGHPGWDMDAKYSYYEHGPLARVEIGDNQVQGVDYAYTLQGWLKGVNSNALDETRDMGHDGSANGDFKYFARDAYSFSLGYFEGDYSSIHENSSSPQPNWYAETNNTDMDAHSHDLWNGNIGIMQTTLFMMNGNALEAENLGIAYKYDQLNRLKEANGFIDFNQTTNSWGSGGEAAKFKNSFSFDANGNINTQKRYQYDRTVGTGTDVLVDDLVYNYHETDPQNPTTNRRISNRLYSVNDAVSNLEYPDDIHDMGEFVYPTQSSPNVHVNGDNNYIYSKIGELVADGQEEIEEIVWRVDSKIKEVNRTTGSEKKSLKFEYDPMGNRIAKYVYDGTELESSTFYVRDAQGTTIAVYDEKVTIEEIGGVNTPTLKYALAERHIYGSSRLGMDTTEVVIPVNATLTVEPTAETNVSRYLGKRLYELSNHLGNVLTVISDRKIAVPVASSTEFGYYRPHIVSVTDYSPFGVALTARTWSDQEYRYGFQAQEQDNEMWSGSVTYKYRVEDPRLGRFFSVDPLSAKYPYYSTYQFSGNRLIDMIELEGLEPAEPSLNTNEADIVNQQLEIGTSMKVLEFVFEELSWWQKILKEAKDFFGVKDFVAESEIDLSIGVQMQLESNGVGGEVNLFSVQILHAKSDWVKGDNECAYLFDDRPGVHIEQNVGVETPIASLEIGQEFEAQSGRYYAHKVNTEFTQKLKSVKNQTNFTNPEENFVGIEIDHSFSRVIGCEINLKIGFNKK